MNPVESNRIGLNLNLAANVVKNFENPKLFEEKSENFFNLRPNEGIQKTEIIENLNL